MKKQIVSFLTIAAAFTARADTVIDFQDLTLPAQSYYNGADGAGGFTSRGALFNNAYDNTYGSWGGFSYSNQTDQTTVGYGNQYSSFAGGGSAANGTTVPGGIFGVAYVDTYTPTIPTITLPLGQSMPLSLRITNTTYTALSMKDGDFAAKKFGGADGTDPDWFLLTIEGFTSGSVSTGTVDFYLADYRFANNAQDYIVNAWQPVDLTPLGTNVASLTFNLSSSDSGIFGMNTPAYFAVDNVTVAPEPSSSLLGGLGIFLLATMSRPARFGRKV
jgi:hypothetical protein